VTLLAFGNGAPDVFSALSAVQNMKNDDVGLVLGALLGIVYMLLLNGLQLLEFLCILFAFSAVTLGWLYRDHPTRICTTQAVCR